MKHEEKDKETTNSSQYNNEAMNNEFINSRNNINENINYNIGINNNMIINFNHIEIVEGKILNVNYNHDKNKKNIINPDLKDQIQAANNHLKKFSKVLNQTFLLKGFLQKYVSNIKNCSLVVLYENVSEIPLEAVKNDNFVSKLKESSIDKLDEFLNIQEYELIQISD